MNWTNVLTIYGKELRDMLRDRRTIISMIVIPTLVMPVLLAVVVFISARVQRDVAATAPTVVLMGGDDSPLARQAFLAHDKVQFVSDSSNWEQRIADKKLRAAVRISAGFDATLAQGGTAGVEIFRYEGEMRSDRAASEVRSFFAAYGERIVTARLAERGLSPATIKPLQIQTKNVAPPEKVGGNFIGGIIPYFFLLIAFSGAMYPAMDLTAGEKERGTMETLLCSPVARIDIVLGKFLMILTASLSTVIFSVTSMGLTFTFGGPFLAHKLLGVSGPAAAKAAEKVAQMTTLDPVGLAAVVVMVLPMIVLFAAGLFTISLFAKSFKEAQSYVSPLFIAILTPAMIGTLPGVELNTKLALVPILNVSLASKELVSGVWQWNYLTLIFGSTCIYATLALALSVRMFSREGVIFRA